MKMIAGNSNVCRYSLKQALCLVNSKTGRVMQYFKWMGSRLLGHCHAISPSLDFVSGLMPLGYEPTLKIEVI